MRSKSHSIQHVSVTRRLGAVLSTVALLASTFAAGMSAQNMKMPAGRSTAKLSQDQRILHVLNRLAFGPRPGDFEHVRAIGDALRRGNNMPARPFDLLPDINRCDTPTSRVQRGAVAHPVDRSVAGGGTKIITAPNEVCVGL